MSNDPWQTEQGELEKKWRNEINEVKSPAAFLATLLRKQIGDPIRRQGMVRDLLKIAQNCGRENDKEYLTRLVEDEMRARKELRDMDKPKDPNNLNDWFPRNKDGKGMTTLSTALDEEKKRIEAAQAQTSFDEITNATPNPDAPDALKSPFASGEIHWTHDAKKVQALHDALLVAHKERGFPEQKSDVEKGLRDYLDSLNLISITDYKGTGQELKKGYLAYMENRLPKSNGAKPPVQPQSKTAPQQGAARSHAPLTADQIVTKYTVNLQGKDYLQVAGRVLLFRLKHPEGAIASDLVQMDERGVTFQARICNEAGQILATGYAQVLYAGDSKRYSGRVMEKAETSAIGRALAFAGFGTDQADADLDEEDALSDSPVNAA